MKISWLPTVAGAAVIATVIRAAFFTPLEAKQGAAQKIFYLHVPAAEAQKLVALKSARSYTSAQKDLLEASLRHLEDAAQMYDALSNRANWNTIECFDGTRNQMRPAEDISKEVLGTVLMTSQLSKAGGR